MTQSSLDQVVQTLLHEGYILYPYGASSQKNQRERFTFGRVYPRAYSERQDGKEPYFAQAECLVRGAPSLDISLRFIQSIRREKHQWFEAAERVVIAPPKAIAGSPMSNFFHFEPCEGLIEIATAPVDGRVYRVTVRIVNVTPIEPEEMNDSMTLMARTFTSVHVILHAPDGEFLSLTDPPPEYADSVRKCENVGVWPVLAGDDGRADAMLASPVILYDYPQVAGERPGDRRDGAEVDELSTLRVRTMTDAEKFEMHEVDAYARRILERTER